MTALPNRPHMSVEEYLRLDRSSDETRYEYIDGIVTMLAGGTADHSTISVNITSILHRLLRASPCRVYNSDLRVRLSETRYVYPDISISCHEQDRGRIDTVQFPRLIIEVLSPGTAKYDRGMKFTYYRECPTVQEYVLIDTQRPLIDVYRKQTSNLWTLHIFGEGDEIEFASLNIRFPIASVYEHVSFIEEDNSPA
ncbi:MAG TPA: Uma2 family endonuclease [Ktedonosporobacter sp.]|jgi:Uma2 family endonuclease|nr:Uma2 family endonuclease [Ktedonosporobacter sp.]